MKRILAFAGVLFAVMTFAPTAHAVMDRTHAAQQCHEEVHQRAMQNFFWEGTVYVSGWWPNNAWDGTVQIDYYSGSAYTEHLYRRRFQCHYVANNNGNYGLTDIAFRFIWPQGYPPTEQLR
jgi:hypothetical protein